MAAGDLVLDVSLSCAWCCADEASPKAWAILSGLQSAQAHAPSLWLWDTANVLVPVQGRDAPVQDWTPDGSR